MTRPHLLACLLPGLWLAATAVADLAPTRYVGGGISPVDAPDVRMLSAKVDIEWGTPCKLSAEFVLDNQGDRAAAIEVGFPVPLPDSGYFSGVHMPEDPPEKDDPLNFSLSFDDAPAVPADITQVTDDRESDVRDCRWYRCKHTFPPGRSRVKVATRLPPTLDYNRSKVENLYYLIWTGAFWRGTIGSEEVNVHFPEPVTPAQILEATPKDYTIEGNTVRWRFTDFEPRERDHDISLRYLRPDVLPELTRLRAEVARNPADARATLTLVKDLFALCPHKQFYGEPNGFMEAPEFQDILDHLKDRRDRAAFRRHYDRQLDGSYRSNSDARTTPSREDIVWRLNRSGYVPREPLPAEASEAKVLIERLLKEQPHNADAWSVYLVNYRHIHHARLWYTNEGYLPLEKELIDKAYANCPADPLIRLLWSKRAWYLGLTSATHESKAAMYRRFDIEKKLLEMLKAHDVNADSFRQIDYGYY